MHRSMFLAGAGLRFAQKDSFNRPTRVQGAVRLFAIAQQALCGGFFFVKGLRAHAASLFRSAKKSFANASEREKQIRKPSQGVC